LVLSYLRWQRLDADISRHPQLGQGGQAPNHPGLLRAGRHQSSFTCCAWWFSVGAIRRYSKPGASVGKQSRSTLLATRPAPPPVNSPRPSASPRRVCGGYAKLTGRPARYRSLRRSGIECALLTSPVAVDQLRLPGSAV